MNTENNLHAYLLDTRHAKSFDESPFNEIDGLVLSQVANLHLEGSGIELGNGRSVTVANVYKAMTSGSAEAKAAYNRMGETNQAFIKELAANPRYMNMELSNFVEDPVRKGFRHDLFQTVGKEEITEQFAAVTVTYTQNGKTVNYVSYRATDSSLDGWIEDFEMLYAPVTQAQADSVAYMNYVAKHTDGAIVGGGHSKGGNDFEYAYLFCDEEARRRIEKGYVYDSPGLRDEIIAESGRYEDYKRITNGTSVCPEDSIIGQLLHEAGNSKYVKSTEDNGLAAHDPYSWQMVYNETTGQWEFEYGKQSELSKEINKALDETVKYLTPEEREALFRLFACILYNCGEDNMDDIIKNLVPSIMGRVVDKDGHFNIKELFFIISEYFFENGWDRLSDEQKKTIKRLLGRLLGEAVSYWWENDLDPRVREAIETPFVIIDRGFNTIHEFLEEHGGPLYHTAVDFFNDVKNFAIDTINGLKKWAYKTFNRGYKYAQTHSYIYVDTNELRSYATELVKLNTRLKDLEDRIHKLYSKLSPSNQMTLQSADVYIGNSSRLTKSLDYLNKTAELFGAAEHDVAQMLK